MNNRILQIVAIIATLWCCSVQASPILELNPVGGAISGTPGSTIGWGFTISNITDYLLLTSATFIPASPVGTFTDYSGYNFIVAGPDPESPTVSQIFDPINDTGVGSFTISSLAVHGTISGQIVLTYDLFSRSPNDPLFNPDTDTLDPMSRELVADASVTVQSAAAPVPEPSTIISLACGIAGLLFMRWRRCQCL